MRAPDLFTALVDYGVLVRVDVVGEGTGRCGPKVREEVMLGVTGNDREGELLEDRSGRGGRGNNGDGGLDDGGWEILNRDICEWDAVNDFLKLKMDVGVLGFVGWRVLKLRA